MKRIKEAFDKKKDGLLSIFITAGYPKLNDTIEVLKELEENGVDMVELRMVLTWWNWEYHFLAS